MNPLSIEILGKEHVVSKNALSKFKKSLKKIHGASESKEEFLAEIVQNNVQFNKYLKEDYVFNIAHKTANTFGVTILEDKVKVSTKRHREMLKNKLRSLKNNRNNIFGKKIDSLKKRHDGKLLEKYVAAKRENFKFKPNKDGSMTMSGNKSLEVPDPDEVLRDTGKWRSEFGEFKETVDTMEKSNNYFTSSAYYKYISSVLETIDI